MMDCVLLLATLLQTAGGQPQANDNPPDRPVPPPSIVVGGEPNVGIADRVAALARALVSGDESAEKELVKLGAGALEPLSMEADNLRVEGRGDVEARAKRLEEVIGRIRRDVDARVDALIGQLDDDNAGVRQEAQKELISIGAPALDKVRAASPDDDAETRWRKKEIARTIELGPWKKILHDHGLITDDCTEIQPRLAERFFPNDRFFRVAADAGEGGDRHVRVSRNGDLADIPLSGGGNITDTIGRHRPALSTEQEAADFLRLIVSTRYGFSGDEIAGVKPEKADGNVWRAVVGIRTFTVTLDGGHRVVAIKME